MVFYLVLIAGGIWVYLNPDVLRSQFEFLSPGSQNQRDEASVGSQNASATDDTVDYAAQAADFYSQGRMDEAIAAYQQAAVADPTVGLSLPGSSAFALSIRHGIWGCPG